MHEDRDADAFDNLPSVRLKQYGYTHVPGYGIYDNDDIAAASGLKARTINHNYRQCGAHVDVVLSIISAAELAEAATSASREWSVVEVVEALWSNYDSTGNMSLLFQQLTSSGVLVRVPGVTDDEIYFAIGGVEIANREMAKAIKDRTLTLPRGIEDATTASFRKQCAVVRRATAVLASLFTKVPTPTMPVRDVIHAHSTEDRIAGQRKRCLEILTKVLTDNEVVQDTVDRHVEDVVWNALRDVDQTLYKRTIFWNDITRYYDNKVTSIRRMLDSAASIVLDLKLAKGDNLFDCLVGAVPRCTKHLELVRDQIVTQAIRHAPTSARYVGGYVQRLATHYPLY